MKYWLGNDKLLCINVVKSSVGYVCDGKQDCPMGDDEGQCNNQQCHHMLRCKDHSTCVHYFDVCNEVLDCPHGDDELYCDLPQCPANCTCHHHVIGILEVH